MILTASPPAFLAPLAAGSGLEPSLMSPHSEGSRWCQHFSAGLQLLRHKRLCQLVSEQDSAPSAAVQVVLGGPSRRSRKRGWQDGVQSQGSHGWRVQPRERGSAPPCLMTSGPGCDLPLCSASHSGPLPPGPAAPLARSGRGLWGLVPLSRPGAEPRSTPNTDTWISESQSCGVKPKAERTHRPDWASTGPLG